MTISLKSLIFGFLTLYSAQPDGLISGETGKNHKEKIKSVNLLARCRKMLAIQKEVLKATLELHQAEQKAKIKKPGLKLAEKEKIIIAEAMKTITTLKVEGSVAFREVIQDLSKDMIQIRNRLENGDFGLTTQALEKDVVETLQEAVKSLTKG